MPIASSTAGETKFSLAISSMQVCWRSTSRAIARAISGSVCDERHGRSFCRARARERERAVGAAEAERVGERDAHRRLAHDVGHVVEIAVRIGVVWLMVGGIMPSRSASAVKIASMPPAPPSAWPVIDLVDETASLRACSPNTRLIAIVSVMSLTGARAVRVDVVDVARAEAARRASPLRIASCAPRPLVRRGHVVRVA